MSDRVTSVTVFASGKLGLDALEVRENQVVAGGRLNIASGLALDFDTVEKVPGLTSTEFIIHGLLPIVTSVSATLIADWIRRKLIAGKGALKIQIHGKWVSESSETEITKVLLDL